MKSYNLTQFRKDLSELSIELDKNQEEQFMQYYELLIQWNEVMNLTAITDFDEVLKKTLCRQSFFNKSGAGADEGRVLSH